MSYDINRTGRWTLYAAGAILIFMGALAILEPLYAVVSASVFMGFGFLLSGVNNLIPYFTTKNDPLRPKWLLPLGIIDIVLGVFFLSHIWAAMFAITTLVGVWLLLTGCMRIYAASAVRGAGAQKWWLVLLNGVILILASAVLLSNPVSATVGMAWLAGIALVGTGVLMIAEGRVVYPADASRSS